MKRKISTFFHPTSSLIKLSLLLWSSLWLTACQTPPLQVYYAMNEGVDLSQYQSFSIEVVNDADGQYHDYITEGIIESLSDKGYRTSEQADLIVRYSLEFITDEQLQFECIPNQEITDTKTSMEAVFEAKMLVNIIDTRTNNVIWKAATTRDLTSVNLKKVDQESVNKRIEELFESFPSR